MNKFMEEIKNQQILHEDELTRLLNQISQLHEENLKFEADKVKQIKALKETHER